MDVRRRNNVIETGRDNTPVLFDHVGLGGSERTARSPQRRYATLDGYYRGGFSAADMITPDAIAASSGIATLIATPPAAPIRRRPRRE